MNGATIFLARNGSPVAKIVPLGETEMLRPIGLHDIGRDSTPEEIAVAMEPLMTDEQVEAWLNEKW
jgi:antitoxin (DNA-binding transcriptional repressor) of toxin-antitoxin stability system